MPRNVSRSRNKPPVSVVNVVSFDKDARGSRKRHRSSRGRLSQDIQRDLVKDIVMGGVNTLAKGAVIFLSAFMVYTVYPVARDLADGVKPFSGRAVKVHVPSDLDGDSRRALTLNLGGGDCLWQVRLLCATKTCRDVS